MSDSGYTTYVRNRAAISGRESPAGPCPGLESEWELAFDDDDLYPTRHLRFGAPMTPKWRRISTGPTHPDPEPPPPIGEWCPYRQRFLDLGEDS